MNFGANGTNALFLNDFFPDAMQLSEGRTSGRLRLFGDLHAMNLEGTQIVSGLKLGIEPLSTKYEIKKRHGAVYKQFDFVPVFQTL